MFITFNLLWIIFRRVLKIAKSDYYLRHVSPSVCLSIRKDNAAPTERIFMKFDILSIFLKSIEKTQVSLYSDKNNGYFT